MKRTRNSDLNIRRSSVTSNFNYFGRFMPYAHRLIERYISTKCHENPLKNVGDMKQT